MASDLVRANSSLHNLQRLDYFRGWLLEAKTTVLTSAISATTAKQVGRVREIYDRVYVVPNILTFHFFLFLFLISSFPFFFVCLFFIYAGNVLRAPSTIFPLKAIIFFLFCF